MPEKDGKLSRSELDAVVNWLKTHTKENACSVCGTRDWIVDHNLANIPVYYPGAALVVGAPSFPLVVLGCKNCGHIRFFSATMMKLVAGSEDVPKAPTIEGATTGTANTGVQSGQS